MMKFVIANIGIDRICINNQYRPVKYIKNFKNYDTNQNYTNIINHFKNHTFLFSEVHNSTLKISTNQNRLTQKYETNPYNNYLIQSCLKINESIYKSIHWLDCNISGIIFFNIHRKININSSLLNDLKKINFPHHNNIIFAGDFNIDDTFYDIHNFFISNNFKELSTSYIYASSNSMPQT